MLHLSGFLDSFAEDAVEHEGSNHCGGVQRAVERETEEDQAGSRVIREQEVLAPQGDGREEDGLEVDEEAAEGVEQGGREAEGGDHVLERLGILLVECPHNQS